MLRRIVVFDGCLVVRLMQTTRDDFEVMCFCCVVGEALDVGDLRGPQHIDARLMLGSTSATRADLETSMSIV